MPSLAERAVRMEIPGPSPFVAVPAGPGGLLRVLGPPPQEAGGAVDPLVKLDHPVGVAQSVAAALCDSAGHCVQLLELVLLLDPSTVLPNEQVPPAAVVECLRRLAGVRGRLPRPVGLEWVSAVLGEAPRLAPLFYCRKRHAVFAARSPQTGEVLSRLDAEHEERASSATADTVLPPALLFWDGPSPQGNGSPSIYGGRGGSSSVGRVDGLEQLVLDQARVVELAASLSGSDPVAYQEMAGTHLCCTCPERERCYPTNSGYAFVVDRLAVVNAAEVPLLAQPLGEFQLAEVAAILGGAGPAQSLAATESAALDQWRQSRISGMESNGAGRLLAGETGGRELVEVARLKLSIFVHALEQLEAAWRITSGPHLCWNDQTLRVTWQPSAQVPATHWGFQGILRKIGWQPASPFDTVEGTPLPYPPAYSDNSLLPAEAVEAARYFNQARRGSLYVKTAAPISGGQRMDALLEDTGIPWELCCTGDTLHVEGESWNAVLSPAAQRNPDDGAGLPFSGLIHGAGALKPATQLSDCTFRFYPRFNEAVDLHALGVLLLETLVRHDEHADGRFRAMFAEHRSDLTKSCLAVALDQRESQAIGWIHGRADEDSPGSLWTRRNLLIRRDDRAKAALLNFPPSLWQAILVFAFRLATAIPGFSFSPDRSSAAPRIGSGLLLPLVEARGLLAMCDDVIFGRSGMVQSLRNVLGGGR